MNLAEGFLDTLARNQFLEERNACYDANCHGLAGELNGPVPDGLHNSSAEADVQDFFCSSLLLLSLELSDAKVYEPSKRTLFETAIPFCEVVFLKSRLAGAKR